MALGGRGRYQPGHAAPVVGSIDFDQHHLMYGEEKSRKQGTLSENSAQP